MKRMPLALTKRKTNMKDDNVPKDAPRLKDPHHDGIIEWTYFNRTFWLRHGISKIWTAPKRAHVTAARVKMWATLLSMDELNRSTL